MADPLEFTGNSFGGGTGIETQIKGLTAPDMGGGLDLSFLKDLVKPRPPARALQQQQAPAAPAPERIMYNEGVTPQGVRYRVAMNGPTAGQVEYTGGMPERFGGYVGTSPNYPSAGGR
jgi:hypothetical protein